MLSLGVVILASYLLGSIPSSVWVGKVYKGIDIREHGSGNAGATNTFRMLGWKAGAVVALIDFSKGFVAAYFVYKLAFVVGSGPVTIPNWDAYAFLKIVSGMSAVIGHMFPLYASFKGGKGVITAAGLLYGIEPISISLSLAVFMVLLFSTRYVSLASIVASFLYPIFLIILRYVFGLDIDGSLIIFGALIGLGIIIKHHGNIKRLIQGNENRIRSFSPAKGRLNKEQEAA